MSDFSHLHLHTTYSFLDGMVRPRELATRCQDLGLSSCAVTDHCHMGSALSVYANLREAGVKPILGMEADTKRFGHLIVLARNNDGYDNLRELATIQQKGKIESSDLLRLSDGLAFTTSCVANKVSASCARGNMDIAEEYLDELLSVVGDVYLELQPTAGPHLRANSLLQELAEKSSLRCVVTNDVHYLTPDQHKAQNILMSIRQGKRRGEGHQHPAPVYYLRSGDEMREACVSAGIDLEHIATTMELAEMCNVELTLDKPDLPPFSPDDNQLFTDKCWESLAARGLNEPVYRERLQTELDVIIDKGFPGYYLIVQDFTNWARANGCSVGPGRGSGAGSLAAYVLGITDLDPIEHKLFFERFLNPERKSMPDFDIDFMQAKRGEVIDYVVEKWGREHTGQIATYMAIHPATAIKDTARVLGLPYGEVNEYTKPIPNTLKAHTPEEEAMSEWDLAMTHVPELVKRGKNDEEYRELLAIAEQIIGCCRQTGKHAGGVVIGREALTHYTPLTADSRTQYDMKDVERAGLVKFDFLGLKTLDVIQKASDEVGVDIRSLSTSDPDVYRMIAEGDTWGLFQVESPGMTRMCQELKPDRFDDIVAAVALYRPGPMESGMLASFIKRKHGVEDVEYAHPDLEPVLKDTYGTFVYQEQVMQAAQVLAGYTLGGADLLRRAMGKKNADEMAKQRSVFVDGCLKNNISKELADELFDTIEKFAGYGFNRSHAAAYALITYQTAWLKLHHREEFAAALLTIESGDLEKLAKYVRYVRGSGIKILPPDVNLSTKDFTTEGESVRWGLGAIKGMGGSQLPSVIENSPYTDLYDLAERSGMPKSAMKTLVDSGACDRFHDNRESMRKSLMSAVSRGKKEKVSNLSGQTSMFGQVEVGVTYPEAEQCHEDLSLEYKVLGSFVSGHPASNLDKSRPGALDIEEGKVTGVVVDVFERRSKKTGKNWAKITIEDEEASMAVLLFASEWEKMSKSFSVGNLVTFYGYVKSQEFIAGGCDVH